MRCWPDGPGWENPAVGVHYGEAEVCRGVPHDSHDSHDDRPQDQSRYVRRFPHPARPCARRESPMPKRTFQPNRRHRAKTHGFLTRMKTKAGAAVLSRRRAKGRHKIAVSAGYRD